MKLYSRIVRFNVYDSLSIVVLFFFSPDSNDVICFVQRRYLVSSGMFTHIRFGSGKSILPRGLENDLAQGWVKFLMKEPHVKIQKSPILFEVLMQIE